MSLLYNLEQRQIGDNARRVLEAGYSPGLLKDLLLEKGQYDAAVWSLCRDSGWTALAIPEAYGGLGLSLIDLCLIADAMGRVVGGVPFLTSSDAAAQALLLGGDEALMAELLPALASGCRTGTIAFAEAGESVPRYPALRYRNGHVDGAKGGVLAGAWAELIVVLAATADGPVLAVVDSSDGGVTREVLNSYDNSRGLAMLRFDGARARALSRVDASSRAWQVLERAAVVLAAEQVGGADRCLELARNHAIDRRAFGQPIGAFQAIKHRIAEMYVANQIARANCLEAALLIHSGMDGAAMAAAARISAIEAYDLATREGIQVFGGMGVTWESDMHLHLRRARSTASLFGSRLIWEDRLVSVLEQLA